MTDAGVDGCMENARPNGAKPKWTVLPNGRPGMELPLQKGVRVYLAHDGVKRLCRHGECSSTIFKYKSREDKARYSVCDCKNADGLTAARRSKQPDDWDPPTFYEILVMNDTEEVEQPGGRKARFIPYSDANGACPAFMLPSGQLRCRHGNSESTLRRKMKNPELKLKADCGCELGEATWRRLSLGTAKKRISQPSS